VGGSNVCNESVQIAQIDIVFGVYRFAMRRPAAHGETRVAIGVEADSAMTVLAMNMLDEAGTVFVIRILNEKL
jgi:hypothetical protein